MPQLYIGGFAIAYDQYVVIELADKLYNSVTVVFVLHKISFSKARPGIEPDALLCRRVL